MSTLLIDLERDELTQEEVELLEHPLVAGVILFTRNFHDLWQLQHLISSIRRAVKRLLLTRRSDLPWLGKPAGKWPPK